MEGLRTLDVYAMVQKHPSQLEGFFVFHDHVLKADDIRALWQVQFSHDSDLGEEQAYVHLDEFLDDCEDGIQIEGSCQCTLGVYLLGALLYHLRDFQNLLPFRSSTVMIQNCPKQ